MELKGRYRVGSYPLAHNGMAEVWPAEDRVLQRPVIIKVLPPTKDLALVERFKREALLTARLNHPGVPRIFDLHAHEGRPYLVLERIDGITLADLVAEQGPLPIAWVAVIGAQISTVLVAAQDIGLVHRDIKPSNAMLEPTGAVKVLDLGLAAIHGDDRYARITESGLSLGTFGYMAPEQIRGTPTDHRTDLYGLGATLFHLLTGEPPFDGETTSAAAARQLAEPPPRPATLRPDVPAPLDHLVHSLLAAEPAQRPSGAAEVLAVLSAHMSGPRPPIPGVTTGSDSAARAYLVAAAGSAPTPMIPPPTRPVERTAEDAERLLAAGKPRAAARLWRELAEEYAERYGESDPRVFEWRLQAARAHLRMNDRSRALRLLEALLTWRIQIVGGDHVSVRELRQEIAQLRSETPTPG